MVKCISKMKRLIADWSLGLMKHDPFYDWCRKRMVKSWVFGTPVADLEKRGRLNNQISQYSLFQSDQTAGKPMDRLIGDRLGHNQHRRSVNYDFWYNRIYSRVLCLGMKAATSSNRLTVAIGRMSSQLVFAYFSVQLTTQLQDGNLKEQHKPKGGSAPWA